MSCTGETYKTHVKMTFAKGASLADPAGLFNSSLDGNVRRAIDIHEGDTVDEKALKALIRSAIDLNSAGKRRCEAVWEIAKERFPRRPRRSAERRVGKESVSTCRSRW